jgi:hypothetical protein
MRWYSIRKTITWAWNTCISIGSLTECSRSTRLLDRVGRSLSSLALTEEAGRAVDIRRRDSATATCIDGVIVMFLLGLVVAAIGVFRTKHA